MLPLIETRKKKALRLAKEPCDADGDCYTSDTSQGVDQGLFADYPHGGDDNGKRQSAPHGGLKADQSVDQQKKYRRQDGVEEGVASCKDCAEFIQQFAPFDCFIFTRVFQARICASRRRWFAGR